jgi:hypothetical protein
MHQHWHTGETWNWFELGAASALIEEAGFQFDRLETGYIRGPKPMTFMYEGSARPM